MKFLGCLIIANLLWASNPIVGEMLLGFFTPFQVAFFRYFLAWVVLLPFCNLIKFQTKLDFFKVSVLGIVCFFIAPLFQVNGLNQSQAINNSVVDMLEPLVTFGVLCLFFKEKVLKSQLTPLITAFGGFLLLANENYLLGNSLLLLSVFGEVAYTAIAKSLVQRYNPKDLIFTALSIAVIGWIITLITTQSLPDAQNWTLSTASLVLWTGIAGTGISYLAWTYALSKGIHAHIISASLFFQALLGVLLGGIVLGQSFNEIQIIGIIAISLSLGWLVKKNLTK